MHLSMRLILQAKKMCSMSGRGIWDAIQRTGSRVRRQQSERTRHRAGMKPTCVGVSRLARARWPSTPSTGG